MNVNTPSNKKRKVNTCGNCRRRKVACDQAVPACSRCVRTNKTETCEYLDDDGVTDNIVVASAPAVSLTHRTASPQAQNVPQQSVHAILDEQSQSLRRLQDELTAVRRELALQRQRDAASSEHRISHPHHQNDTNGAHHDLEITGVKGKSFKTRLFGPSYPKSQLAHIPSLTALSKEIVEANSVLKKIRKDIHGIEHAETKPTSSPNVEIDLLALLPSERSEADGLVHLYLHTFDGIYHVIHRDVFAKEYDHFSSNPSQARPHFVALVLLMCANASSLKREESCLYIGKNSVARHRALKVIYGVEDWLRRNGKQKKTTITDFQIRFLIIFGKAVHGAQFKAGWEAATSALRHAMAAGMHIEPFNSNPEAEMRRRLWRAFAEFELQTAFVRGMPSDPLAQEGNVAAPINVEDSDLASSMSEERPVTTFTSASYLVFASRSFGLRHTLTRVLNSTKTVSFAEARSLTDEIEIHIQQIPEWTGTPQAAAPRALLKVNLLNYLLVLQTQCLRHASGTTDRSASATIILKTAAEIMEIHTSLLESDCHILQTLSHEELRPALAISLLVERLDPAADRIVYHSLYGYAEQVTSSVVDLVADKARLGAGRNKYWLALVADAFVKSWKRPNQRAMYIQDAVNTLAASSYKVIASQATGEAVPNGTSTFKDMARLGANTINGVDEISSIDLDEFSAWTFDDWALNSHHF